MSRIADAILPEDESGAINNNLHRTLANNPAMEAHFAALARGVHTTSHLPHRTRELVILRVASTLRAEVEWAQHFRIAQIVGITPEEARAVRDGNFDGFAPAEQAAIRFAEAVDQTRVNDVAWREASAHFSDVELLDLSVLAGFYGLASRVTLAMGIAVDEGLSCIDES
jgi:alkylhydroperoxidase family enzyme